MIEYDPGKWQVEFVFRLKGSIFPKALCWAIPATLLAAVMHAFVLTRNPTMSMSQLSVYNFVLGFLVVFRSQQAYSRFWEGATIVQQVRGEWFNAVSSCVAFCTNEPARAEDVRSFQHLLVRLASLLYCASLQQIAVLEDEAFEVMNLDGISEESLHYLSNAPEKTLVILQWMQRLVVANCANGVISAPPPVVSRIYQELSRGIVNIVNAQKITDIVFPFPYAQMVSVMLIISTLATPIVMATIMEELGWCCFLTFISVFSYWCINYIAAEIEMPFGEDANDLPIARLQISMNNILKMLLDEECQKAPNFTLNSANENIATEACPFYLITDVQHRVFSPDHPKMARMEGIHARQSVTMVAATVATPAMSAIQRAASRLKSVYSEAAGPTPTQKHPGDPGETPTQRRVADGLQTLAEEHEEQEASRGSSLPQASEAEDGEHVAAVPQTSRSHTQISFSGDVETCIVATASTASCNILEEATDSIKEARSTQPIEEVRACPVAKSPEPHALDLVHFGNVAEASLGQQPLDAPSSTIDGLISKMLVDMDRHFCSIVNDVAGIARTASHPPEAHVLQLSASLEVHFSRVAAELGFLAASVSSAARKKDVRSVDRHPMIL